MNAAPRNHTPLLVLVALLGIAGAGQFLPNTLGIPLICAAVFFEFARELDFGVPIEMIGCVLACVQWLLGPLLAYRLDVDIDRYQMYVEEAEYFAFALPGTCAFICGMVSFSGQGEERQLLRMRDGRDDFRIGVVLLVGAVASEYARPFAPGGLSFAFHLLSQLRYIAAIYFLLSDHRLKWICFVAATFQLFVRSAESAMFHDLILWAGLLSCFWWMLRHRTTFAKITYFVIAFVFVSTIQTVKREYRDAAWSGQSPSFLAVTYDVVVRRMEFKEQSTIDSAIVRINQGWIISAVLHHVPEGEPFAGGETIKDAIVASTMPRFLAPNKKKAGGQENFRRFTGLPLANTTSMGISPLGEAYANFGRVGGIFFMLVWGSVFALGIGAVRHFGRRDPHFLIWTPLIFYQAIKVETEIVVVMNQLTKGTVIAFAVYFFIHRIWLKNAGRVEGEIPEFEPTAIRGSLADIQRH